MMENFAISQTKQNDEFKNHNIHINEIHKKLASKVDSITIHTKMLNTQIFQVAEQQSSSSVPTEIFVGEPEQIPKGHLNIAILRNEK